MAAPLKQHLIDPEICIRCYTCEETCTIGAISHNDDNVVVDASICAGCMDCIAPCPTGSIDEWRVVTKAYSLEEQLGWMELPEQGALESEDQGSQVFFRGAWMMILQLCWKKLIVALQKLKLPHLLQKPTINLHSISNPAASDSAGEFSPDKRRCR